MKNDVIETLGTKLKGGYERDAIHVAVEPVTALETLRPGQHVGLREYRKVHSQEKHVGIIDPFIKSAVRKGERCWLLLYPGTIVSLRHIWEHPDCPLEPPSSEPTQFDKSLEWISNFASIYGYSPQTMIRYATNYLDNGDFLVGGEELEGERVPDEFWEHYENVAQRKVKRNDRGDFFSCSC